jgi:hypothetical protein
MKGMKDMKMRSCVLVLTMMLMGAAPAFAQRGSAPAAPPAPPAAPALPARGQTPPRPVPPAMAPPMSEEAMQVVPPAPPLAPRPPSGPKTWRTVRVDIAITDTTAAATLKKFVSLTLVDGRRGSVRAQGAGRLLNADAIATLPDSEMIAELARRNVRPNPALGEEGKILLELTIGYQPSNDPSNASGVNETITVVVPNGVPTVVSQAADPMSDRKVTLEVTATQVK